MAATKVIGRAPTVRGILRRAFGKAWSRYGLAVGVGLTAAVGCGTEGGTGVAADYALSLTPAALTVVQGTNGTANVTITRTNFTGAVTLSLGNAPAGVTGSFDPAAPTGTTSVLTLTVGATVTPGIQNLTVDGTASTGNRSTPLALTLNLAGGGGNVATIAAGYGDGCALNVSGQAFCWGNNLAGNLGDGTTTNRLVPTPVAGGLTFASLSAGYFRTCGVTTSGTAYCWGSVVGDSTITNRLVPTPVAGGLTFASLSAGVLAHTCGVTTGGVAYCWGGNLAGELGDGTTNMPEFVPTPVAGGLAFTAVSAGAYHTCGVTTNGGAYCWGSNAFGQFGDGTTTDRPVPAPVAGGLTFASVSAGWWHTCGVTTSGAAYCWGDNSFLGDGTNTGRLVPTPVAGSLTFTTLSAGPGETCGVTTSGAAYCWGYNAFGQLGDGTTISRLLPTPVTGGLTFAVVSAGVEVETGHACGVTRGGAAYCWGANNGGLGDGTTPDRSVPTPVAFP